MINGGHATLVLQFVHTDEFILPEDSRIPARRIKSRRLCEPNERMISGFESRTNEQSLPISDLAKMRVARMIQV